MYAGSRQDLLRSLLGAEPGSLLGRALGNPLLARFAELETLVRNLDDPGNAYALCESCALSLRW